MTRPGQPAAEDPERYHRDSTIRQYLAAKPAGAVMPDLLLAAVHERWAVKTGADADAQALTGQAPTPSTIADLRAQNNTMIAEIPNPGDITAPSYFAEQISNARTTFDNHFQLAENINAPTAPAALGPGGAAQVQAAQTQQVAVPVTVTGLGYFDFNHGQLGVAPNAIELHPVINIVFNG